LAEVPFDHISKNVLYAQQHEDSAIEAVLLLRIVVPDFNLILAVVEPLSKVLNIFKQGHIFVVALIFYDAVEDINPVILQFNEKPML
jgi:hypothetical protein